MQDIHIQHMAANVQGKLDFIINYGFDFNVISPSHQCAVAMKLRLDRDGYQTITPLESAWLATILAELAPEVALRKLGR